VREAASVLKALGYEWVGLPGLESPDGVRRPRTTSGCTSVTPSSLSTSTAAERVSVTTL
jgi:hypothetical protein